MSSSYEINSGLPPTAQAVSTSYSYKVDMWDRFSELIDKLMISKADVKQFQSLIKETSSLYESIGKKLCKTKLVTEKNSFETIEPFDRLATGFQTIGNQYLDAAKELQENLFKEITLLRKELSKAIKMANKDEKKLRSDFNSAKHDAQQAKQKDLEEKKHLEDLQIALYSDPNLPPKKMEKLNKDINNYEKRSKKAEEDYDLAIKKLHEMDQKYYIQLGQIMQNLEVLDRKRGKELKDLLRRFSKLNFNIGKSTSAQSDYMEQSFDAMNEEREIQTFIASTRSGFQPPAPDSFEPYIIKIPDELNKKRFSTMPGGVSVGSPSGTGSAASVKVSSPIPESSSKTTPSTTPNNNNGTSTQPPPFDSTSTTVKSVVKEIVKQETEIPTKVIKTVTCVYGYDAAEEGELTIKEGDYINVLAMNDDGWWLGINNRGETGLFPSNFVESTQGSVVPEDLLNITAGSKVVAQYDYDAQDEQEISFKAGEIITVVEVNSDGWFVGRNANNKEGLIPSNFFKLA
ncbi:hypothetical protein C9374_003370 [Naegleria lovaniensis]|uniref:SH3 domain-containing protein n=1 Tax=Naegleria lovaniensis TaxID=51637 RepID=A0AA88KJE5_NAELO|nr:uncharacterized protein C9374_003370 [Naegleria lovaniensis]KAG2385555.1 hypothetical protein C9374_003370 [Naegleria lovaniensis]